jgi:hypothetical protein
LSPIDPEGIEEGTIYSQRTTFLLHLMVFLSME